MGDRWGIPLLQTNTVADYTDMGLDPCTYVGWSGRPWNAPSNEGGNAYGNCLYELFANWYTTHPLA